MTPLQHAINSVIIALDDELDPRRKIKVQNCLNDLQALHPNPHRDCDKAMVAKFTQDWKAKIGRSL